MRISIENIIKLLDEIMSLLQSFQKVFLSFDFLTDKRKIFGDGENLRYQLFVLATREFNTLSVWFGRSRARGYRWTVKAHYLCRLSTGICDYIFT